MAAMMTVLMAVAATGATAQSVDGVGLEEVLVTARKRVENLQEVPVSVIAVSAEPIERRSVSDLADLQKPTPGASK